MPSSPTHLRGAAAGSVDNLSAGAGIRRPIDAKHRSFVRSRIDLDPTLMIRDDAPALAQAESQSAAGLPPGIERIEQVLSIRFAQAGTVIFDAQDCKRRG